MLRRIIFCVIRRKLAAERDFILREIAVVKSIRNLKKMNTSREQLIELSLGGTGVDNQAALRIVLRQNAEARDKLIADLKI